MDSSAAHESAAVSEPSNTEADWRDLAICSAPDVQEVFFPVGVTGMAAVQIENAKAVCTSCPVRETCLEYAITTNQEYGIWGGTSEEERRVLRRKWRVEQRALKAARREEQRRQRRAS